MDLVQANSCLGLDMTQQISQILANNIRFHNCCALLWILSWPTKSESRSCIICSKFHNNIKWKHFPCNWPFVRGIHRSPANSSHKGQWRGALMFSLNYASISDWINNREAGDLRRHGTHYEVNTMKFRPRCWEISELTVNYIVIPEGLVQR